MKRLTALVGDAGKRLHTWAARVTIRWPTDVRLYTRAACDNVAMLLVKLQQALVALAEQHADTILPGFTHLQVAMPVTLGHHLMRVC